MPQTAAAEAAPARNIVTSWAQRAAAAKPPAEGRQPAQGGGQERAAPLSPAPWPAATFAQLRKVPLCCAHRELTALIGASVPAAVVDVRWGVVNDLRTALSRYGHRPSNGGNVCYMLCGTGSKCLDVIPLKQQYSTDSSS